MDADLILIYRSGLFCGSLRKLGGDCQLWLGALLQLCNRLKRRNSLQPIRDRAIYMRLRQIQNYLSEMSRRIRKTVLLSMKEVGTCLHRKCIFSHMRPSDFRLDRLWTFWIYDLISLYISYTPNGDVWFRSPNQIRLNDIICQKRGQISAPCGSTSR